MEDDLKKRNTDCVYFLASPLTCKKVYSTMDMYAMLDITGENVSALSQLLHCALCANKWLLQLPSSRVCTIIQAIYVYRQEFKVQCLEFIVVTGSVSFRILLILSNNYSNVYSWVFLKAVSACFFMKSATPWPQNHSLILFPEMLHEFEIRLFPHYICPKRRLLTTAGLFIHTVWQVVWAASVTIHPLFGIHTVWQVVWAASVTIHPLFGRNQLTKFYCFDAACKSQVCALVREMHHNISTESFTKDIFAWMDSQVGGFSKLRWDSAKNGRYIFLNGAELLRKISTPTKVCTWSTSIVMGKRLLMLSHSSMSFVDISNMCSILQLLLSSITKPIVIEEPVFEHLKSIPTASGGYNPSLMYVVASKVHYYLFRSWKIYCHYVVCCCWKSGVSTLAHCLVPRLFELPRKTCLCN
ncbi:hypothetical protein ACHQM5_023782 [Ranunculus cassubicifolius]